MKKALVLYAPTGSGKSAVGYRLVMELGLPLFNVRQNMPIELRPLMLVEAQTPDTDIVSLDNFLRCERYKVKMVNVQNVKTLELIQDVKTWFISP